MRSYIGYAVARLGWPLISLFLALAVLALLLLLFLRYRHKSELLAACLLISAAMHMLMISFFSVWLIQQRIYELVQEAGKYDLSLGLPSLVESVVSQAVRGKLLEMALADTRQFKTEKTSRIEPAEAAVSRAQPEIPQTQPLAPTHEEIELEQVSKPEQKVDEELEVLPEKRPEVMTMEIARLEQAEAKREDPEPRKPEIEEMELEPAPAAEPFKGLPEQRPHLAGLKDPARAPTRQEIELAAERPIEHRVKEIIQAVEMMKTVDRLKLPAEEVPVKAEPVKTEDEIMPEPMAFRRPRPAAVTPEAPSPKVIAPEITDFPARISSASLAGAGPERVERRPVVDVGGITPDAKPSRTLAEPVRVKDTLSTVARVRPTEQRPVPGAFAPADLNAGRSQWNFAVTDGSVDKPRAEIEVSAQPVAAGTLIGPRPEQIARPKLQAPEVQDRLAESASAEAMAQPVVDLGTSAALAETVRKKMEARPAELFDHDELATLKAETRVEETGAFRPRPVPVAAEVTEGPVLEAETLIGPRTEQIARPKSHAPEVQDRLAESIGVESMAQPVVDLGTSAAVVQTARKKVEARPAELFDRGELATLKAETGIEKTEAPLTSRPVQGTAPEVATSHLSLLTEAALAEPTQSRTLIQEGSEIQTAAGKPLDAADVEIVAGSLDMTRDHGPAVETKGVRRRLRARDQRELTGAQVDKVRLPTEADMPKLIKVSPAAPDKAHHGPSGTLVQTDDVQPLTGARTPEAIEVTSITAPAVSRTPEPVRLAITAQTAERQKPTSQRADLSPAALILVAKATGTKALTEAEPLKVPVAGSIGADAGDRLPSRIQLDVTGAGEARIEVPAEISAVGAAEEVRRSLISVEVAHAPESITRKTIYRLRIPAKRKELIEELGGSLETEEAVEQALIWLGKTQSDDGRWDVDGFKLLSQCGGSGDREDGDVAVTGLSLLAYLGAGYTHIEGEHKETVRKALEWLIVGQKANGDLRRGGQMYGQAMATAALCEAYSMTRDKRFLPAAARAVKFIMDAQNPGAGWRYQPREDNDTSVVGWQVLALKSAEIAGIRVPDRHYNWTGAWIDKIRNGQEGGLYSYKPGHAVTPVMTAEGWFCQLFMSEDARTRGATESIDYIMENLPQWAPDSLEVPHLYYWYYATLSLHLSGAKEFDRWNEALSEALLKGRIKDGVAAGSWDPVCQLGTRGGRIYSTAMAALCLEVYYRYLPFYKQK